MSKITQNGLGEYKLGYDSALNDPCIQKELNCILFKLINLIYRLDFSGRLVYGARF